LVAPPETAATTDSYVRAIAPLCPPKASGNAVGFGQSPPIRTHKTVAQEFAGDPPIVWFPVRAITPLFPEPLAEVRAVAPLLGSAYRQGMHNPPRRRLNSTPTRSGDHPPFQQALGQVRAIVSAPFLISARRRRESFGRSPPFWRQ
jgi:hypothetical protein